MMKAFTTKYYLPNTLSNQNCIPPKFYIVQQFGAVHVIKFLEECITNLIPNSNIYFVSIPGYCYLSALDRKLMGPPQSR